ncbi:mannose-1-phosphate guanylyltransferase [Leeuwenhoekiella aestuarii]|uniref:mannose-1-phosphate guanylyltransferase n=1 Tax=Leeuwenhoekiella aestuarii TaxID=2249426 RepID=A0A4V1KNY3_9FLAO|nr:mannose-1-phosphate guanylyltransferase [Leeuwenhoekiella aestuarii]RXG12657.1 mannose-1-phosphate guanylyltransferase [Leeuwenhoekiella aestuarii]RXG14604.1 mannose-1-phosphate guanylyltransferase [Leeuwenhoekiella aestuarii]
MILNKNYYAIIMAGGVGSRFWPLSKANYPKQFHDILGAGETLIERTFGRLSQTVPADNVLVLTNENYKALVNEQLPQVKDENIVLEPAMRNTAPCILLAALKIYKANPDGVMIVAPSDHWIENESAFLTDLETAFKACETDISEEKLLVTLGIEPTFPHTGYGYIQYASGNSAIKNVKAFKEKPDYATAKQFLAAGNYSWNAGIFIWSAKAIIEAFEKYLPEMYALFNSGYEDLNTEKEEAFIQEHYEQAENISIDYGILEKSGNVGVIPATFDWSDLGAWGALYDNLEKDSENNVVVNAKTVIRESKGNLIRSEKGKVVVVDGLQDYIVVDSKEVLVIMPKAKEQDVKIMRALVQEKYGDDLV